MTKTMQILAIATAVIFVGTVSLTVVAMADDSERGGGGFLQHMHAMAQHFHGGGHGHGQGHPMGQLVEQLDLTPDQQQRLHKIHEILGGFGGGSRESMLELHESLIEQYKRGDIGTAEVRSAIDLHLEEVRGMAYSITDELVALVNELDADQKQILLDHIDGDNSASGQGHGH